MRSVALPGESAVVVPVNYSFKIKISRMHLSQKRNHVLDLLRGGAVLLVMFAHIYRPRINESFDTFFLLLLKAISKLQMGGWTGVDLFFVLSGFLISSLLFKEYKKFGYVDFSRFFWRRWYKIIPSFVAFVLIASATEMWFGRFYPEARFPASDYLKDLCFLDNYLDGRWEQTWSLDVEETFYIIFPLFLMVLIRMNKVKLRYFVYGYLSLVLIAVVSRYFANTPHENFRLQFSLTHLRLDALFFGVFLSFLHHTRHRSLDLLCKYQAYVIPVCLAALAINFLVWRGGLKSVILLSSTPVAYGLLMMIAIRVNGLSFKPLSILGQYSYNIYLWHFPLYYYSKDLIRVLHINPQTLSGYLSYIALYFIIGIGAGILFTHLVEKPFLRLRDSRIPSLTGPVLRSLEESSPSLAVG